MLKASTHSKARRKECPRHIACLGNAILLFCSTGKYLFKVNCRSLVKNENKYNHSLINNDYGTPEVHLDYASVFIVDFKYVVNLVLFFLMTFKHVSARLQVSFSYFSFLIYFKIILLDYQLSNSSGIY